MCRGSEFKELFTAERIHREAEYRERFVLDRFNRHPAESELKDLTDFAHGDDRAILACTACGVLLRDEKLSQSTEKYEEDPYDEALVDLLFPRYVTAFRQKAQPYRSLLPAAAQILEVGSHYGAFLQVATEWGWQPVGVDIGKDTFRYSTSKGQVVFNKDLVDCAFPDHIFDGVFVWNCFEQVPEPRPLLHEIHRIVKPTGLLVVRTPNALFYERSESLLALGYNNLLAFPYLYGYGSSHLERLVSSEGFELEGSLNSELLTLPLPEVPDWVTEEQRALSEEIARTNRLAESGPLTGPWIELYYRAA